MSSCSKTLYIRRELNNTPDKIVFAWVDTFCGAFVHWIFAATERKWEFRQLARRSSAAGCVASEPISYLFSERFVWIQKVRFCAKLKKHSLQKRTTCVFLAVGIFSAIWLKRNASAKTILLCVWDTKARHLRVKYFVPETRRRLPIKGNRAIRRKTKDLLLYYLLVTKMTNPLLSNLYCCHNPYNLVKERARAFSPSRML